LDDEPYVGRLLSETHPPGKYLTFRVARQDFAMETDRVRGILPVREMIALQRNAALDIFSAPDPWICGFAALRGRDFPVFDLRSKLGLRHGTHGRTPCIIVVELDGFYGPQLAGFVADRVSEIVEARERDLRGGKLRTGGRPRAVLNPNVLL
jgi:chemotaxis signal transduction protein